jgi:hypothetical protein
LTRDAGGVPSYRINYQGPRDHAVQAARTLADADGIELTASQPVEQKTGSADVVLRLTVEGTTDEVLDAVALTRGRLPAGATIEIAEG